MAVPRKKLKRNKATIAGTKRKSRPKVKLPPGDKLASGAKLLKHWGAWVGDDIDELLKEVIESRSRARF